MNRLVIIFVLSFSCNLLAQEKETIHMQVHWTQFKLVVGLDSASKWDYEFNFQDRRYVFPNRRDQLFIKNSIFYRINKEWRLGAGLLYFEITQPNDPFETNINLQMPEIRPTFSVAQTTRKNRWKFQNRIMGEVRFFQRFNDDFELTGEWWYHYRFRWKNAVSTRISSFKGGLELGFYDEIMFNFGREIIFNAFDQNRLGVFLKQKWSDRWTTGIQFLHWYQQEPNGFRYRSRYISGVSLGMKI
jgi:hypothetical protein